MIYKKAKQIKTRKRTWIDNHADKDVVVTLDLWWFQIIMQIRLSLSLLVSAIHIWKEAKKRIQMIKGESSWPYNAEILAGTWFYRQVELCPNGQGRKRINNCDCSDLHKHFQTVMIRVTFPFKFS